MDECALEYKVGKNDPSREVGRIEKSRAGVKKFIKKLRLRRWFIIIINFIENFCY